MQWGREGEESLFWSHGKDFSLGDFQGRWRDDIQIILKINPKPEALIPNPKPEALIH